MTFRRRASGARARDGVAAWDVHAFRTAFARDQVVRWARSGWLGRLAAEVGMEESLEDLFDRQEEVKLAIFRAHHARGRDAASPLALDLLEHLGLDPGPIVAALRPDGDWRRWVCGAPPPPARGVVLPPWRPAATGDDAGDRERFLHGCIVVRGWSDPAGALGVRLSPAGLEVGACLGPVHMRTLGGIATLTIGEPIPETIKLASVGRPVESLFDHPVLRGRGYVIEDQFDRVPTADDLRAAWRITFRPVPVPWTVPWARRS